MAAFTSRRGPNASQYLRDLNTIKPQDAPAEESFSSSMEEDLALFTNTQFFDFDSGQNTDFQAQPVKVTGKPAPASASTSVPTDEAASAAQSVVGDIPNMDFMQGDFNFPDFATTYPTPNLGPFPDASQNFQPMHHGNGPIYTGHQLPPQSQFPHAAPVGRVPVTQDDSDLVSPDSPSLNFEDSTRNAADEDKRRRNTAASARFRVKKKQREQALEKSAKDMSDKVSSLESKVSQLETENKWLKNLLVEKNHGNEDIATLWSEFTKHAGEKIKKANKEKSKDER